MRKLCKTCKETGEATNIILGLALGYNSAIIPALCMAVTIYISYSLAWMFGIGIAALGILSTLATGLTIDAYGPISDNAGGVTEMCELGEITRTRTDALDAAGNTTAAIGKGMLEAKYLLSLLSVPFAFRFCHWLGRFRVLGIVWCLRHPCRYCRC